MGSDPNRLKIVIVGDGGCGKTVLLYAYTKKKFDERYIPTVLDTYLAEIRVGERKVALEIYDTAGQEDFVQIRTLNITKFWYPETIKTQKACPFVLVGNKLDLATAPNMEYIKPEEAEMVVKRLDGYAALQCSAQQEAQGLSGNVDRVFKTAIKCGLENKVVPPEKEDGCKCIIL